MLIASTLYLNHSLISSFKFCFFGRSHPAMQTEWKKHLIKTTRISQLIDNSFKNNRHYFIFKAIFVQKWQEQPLHEHDDMSIFLIKRNSLICSPTKCKILSIKKALIATIIYFLYCDVGNSLHLLRAH